MDDYSYKVTLEKHPIYTSVLFDDRVSSSQKKSVMNTLKNVMKAHPDGYRWMPRFKQHVWDGYISLMEGTSFPTGLLDIALDALEDSEDVIVEIKDYNTEKVNISSLNENYLNKVVLRDYQLEAVRRLISSERGVAHMATNSGKTVVMAALCKLVNSRTLILTHKKELLYQTQNVIEKLTDMDVSLIGDGIIDFSGQIVIAMVQTLGNIVEDLNNKKERFGFKDIDRFTNIFQMLMVDEVHHVSSKSMMDIVMKVNAPFRFGFSGTPMKYKLLPDMQLAAATGPVLIRVENETLIREGYSAEPEIIMYSIYNGNSHEEDTYPEARKKLIVENQNRNKLISDIVLDHLNQNKVILVLVDQVLHQKLLYKEMCNSHRNHQKYITYMNGSQSMDSRNSNIELMREGDPHIFVATEILGEGVDIPAIDVLVLAGGGKSHIRTLQRVGRGMRRKEDGENRLTVIDFIDQGNKYTERHSSERMNIYEREKFKVVEQIGIQ